jgi:cytochrome c oxidase subunit IV
MRTAEIAFAFSQLLAIAVLADSLIKIQYSTDLLRLQMKKWWIVLLLAGASIALAMTALANPFGDDAKRLTFTYAVLITDGILNIIVVLILRHAHKTYQQRRSAELENTEELDPSELPKPELPKPETEEVPEEK